MLRDKISAKCTFVNFKEDEIEFSKETAPKAGVDKTKY